MTSSAASQKAPIVTTPAWYEPKTAPTKPVEQETDPAAGFVVGALLYSLFAGGNLSEMLPDGDDE